MMETQKPDITVTLMVSGFSLLGGFSGDFLSDVAVLTSNVVETYRLGFDVDPVMVAVDETEQQIIVGFDTGFAALFDFDLNLITETTSDLGRDSYTPIVTENYYIISTDGTSSSARLVRYNKDLSGRINLQTGVGEQIVHDDAGLSLPQGASGVEKIDYDGSTIWENTNYPATLVAGRNGNVFTAQNGQPFRELSGADGSLVNEFSETVPGTPQIFKGMKDHFIFRYIDYLNVYDNNFNLVWQVPQSSSLRYAHFKENKDYFFFTKTSGGQLDIYDKQNGELVDQCYPTDTTNNDAIDSIEINHEFLYYGYSSRIGKNRNTL